MLMNAACARCLLDKKLDAFPADAPAAAAEEYRRRVRALVEGNTTLSSPEVDAEIDHIYERLFGPRVDYAPIKRRFNALMLDLEPSMRRGVQAAEDPLARAVQYAMAGNFIDFAAMDSVDEGELRRLLDRAGEIPVEARALEELRGALASAKNLVYMTDNCGEIVADKVLMATLRALYPSLDITAMVRGAPVVNDATLEDARQVDLEAVARVIGSGCGYAGNPLPRLSGEARAALADADVILAKGQANYETLNGCGLNIFYLFMCKCDLFMERFHVARFAGMLTREDF